MEKPFHIYNKFGDKKYKGEEVTYLEHAIYTAKLAEQYCKEFNILNPFKEELITSCLLHNIGNLLIFEYPNNKYPLIQDIGVRDYEFIGGEFLLSLGFSSVVSEIVKKHIYTKRYLVSINEDYFYTLSKHSRKKLDYQGGLLTKNETLKYQKNNLFDFHIKVREWIDLAKNKKKFEHLNTKDMKIIFNELYQKYILKMSINT